MSKDRVIIKKWKKVSLVVPERRDVELWYTWINNPLTSQMIQTWGWITLFEDEERYYEKILEKRILTFCIFDNESQKIVWLIGLDPINHFHKFAELWIFIWDTKNHNKGFWTESIMLLLDYAFLIQWLRKVILKCFWHNTNAKKVYEKIWFKEVWKFKDHFFKNWEYVDEIHMEIFKEDFYKKMKKFLNNKI